MRTYHDGYHLFPQEMLFNLVTDPYEQHNLAEENPQTCNMLLETLTNWHDHMMLTMPEGYCEDPMRVVLAEGGPTHARGMLSKYSERLKLTGRGKHIAALQEAHPHELI